MDPQLVQQFKAWVDQPQNAVVIPHKNPDGDALGSCLAWARFLSLKGHTVQLVSPNDYPEFLTWLPGQDKIVKFSESPERATEIIQAAQHIYTLDFNDLDRIDELGTLVAQSSASVAMIDHHENPKDYAQLILSMPEIGSTAELVYSLIEALDPSLMDEAMATCLYTGIMTDSGSFRFPATTPRTHRIVAHLLEAGAPHAQIHQNIYDTYTLDRLHLLGTALDNLTQVPDLPVVYICLSQAELDRCQFKKGDTEGFVNYGLSLAGIQLTVIMIENTAEKRIRMSFRSKGSFPANTFAERHFSGGGHHNAAGGTSSLSLTQTRDNLLNHLTQWKTYFQS